jgi:hypothetical protein
MAALPALPVHTTQCPNCLIAKPTTLDHWGTDWSEGSTGRALDLTMCSFCKANQSSQCKECKQTYLNRSDKWADGEDDLCLDCWGRPCAQCGIWDAHATWAAGEPCTHCISMRQVIINPMPSLPLPLPFLPTVLGHRLPLPPAL